jgi:hypothetical protein
VDDFVADHVAGNPGFNAEEIQKAQFFFGRENGMKAFIRQANLDYAENLKDVGVDAAAADPTNKLIDQLRREMTAKQVAALFFMTEQEFLNGLRQSAQGQIAVGQLLQGGTINFQDLSQIVAILIRDLSIFREDLGQ